MKLILPILVMVTTFLHASETNFYTPYKSLANPLYSPWLKDEIFKSINEVLKEPCQELVYVRYLQYILTKTALRNCLGGGYY